MRLNAQSAQTLAAISVLALCACSGESGDNGLPVDVGGAAQSLGGAMSQGGQIAAQGGTVSASGGTSTTVSPNNGGNSARGGSSSSGGAVGSGGATSSGGASNSGGATAKGGAASGGATGKGGATGNGGMSTSGGVTGKGGAPGSGGTTAKGGAASGGATGKGGTTSAGGASTTVGGTSSGGATAKGGTNSAGGAASCTDTAWNPPSTANGNTGIPAGLDKEWARSGATIVAATNLKTRQIMENGGKIRYCARWDSSQPITYQQRQQVAALMAACDTQWTSKLTGWGCWPYSTVDVKVVMWVVRDASLLQGWTASEGSYVVGKVASGDADVACPSDCLQLPGRTQKTSCSAQVYDEFLWLDGDKTDYTGWGYAEGFYMSATHFMAAATANASTETIVAHELGHAHGLNDFYEAAVVPAGWTHFVMMAGSSNVVTDTDGWMLRNVWRHIRSDYGFPAGQ